MNHLLARTLSVALVTASSSAWALSDDQETALKFLGGVFILEKFSDYITPSPAPYYSPGSDIELEYRRGRLDRERREREDAKRRAYECGYTGRCR